MIISGTLLLALMRRYWPRLTAFSERLFGSQSAPI